MADNDDEAMQVIEIIDESSKDAGNSSVSEPLAGKCVICGGRFFPATSRANVCSPACRRERKLRYGAAYRGDLRERRSELNALFGGRKPSQDEILDLLRRRRGDG